jgi:polyhydroxyalkanoate synthesis regulator phasin
LASSNPAFLGWDAELVNTVRAPLDSQQDYHDAPAPHLQPDADTSHQCKEYVMLQANEIQQRFTHIQQTIQEAEQACKQAGDAPDEIRNVIDKLSREAKQAQSVMQSNDQQRIQQCVDNLEDMGDEAKRISRSLPTMPAHLEAAVTRVHAELSDLKHKLH